MARVLLASGSERRRVMINELFPGDGVEIEFCTLEGAEPDPTTGLEVRVQVENASESKAVFLAMKLEKSDIFDLAVVSDTLVEDPDDLEIALGKPKDKLEAASTLIRLSGRRHKVWSSTAIVNRNGHGVNIGHGWSANIFTDYAIVEFDEIDPELLENMVVNGAWIGKAGGYDLAREAGSFSRIILGHESTVLGLSIRAVEELRRMLS